MKVRRSPKVRDDAFWFIYGGIFVPILIVRGSVGINEGYALNEHLMVVIGAAIFSALFGLAPKLFADWAMGSGRPTLFVAWWTGAVSAAAVAVCHSLLAIFFGRVIDYPVWVQLGCLAAVVLCVAGGIFYALRPSRKQSSL